MSRGLPNPLQKRFGELSSVILVEESPDQSAFGIDLAILLCVMVQPYTAKCLDVTLGHREVDVPGENAPRAVTPRDLFQGRVGDS